MSVFRPSVLYILQGLIQACQYGARFILYGVGNPFIRIDDATDGDITQAVPQAAASCMSVNSSTRICRRTTFIPISLASVIRLSLVMDGRIALDRGVRYSLPLMPMKLAAEHSSIYR